MLKFLKNYLARLFARPTQPTPYAEAPSDDVVFHRVDCRAVRAKQRHIQQLQALRLEVMVQGDWTRANTITHQIDENLVQLAAMQVAA